MEKRIKRSWNIKNNQKHADVDHCTTPEAALKSPILDLVPAYLLGQKCAWPATKDTEEVQVILRNSLLAIHGGHFVEDIQSDRGGVYG